jgi:uncharacterized protein (TIGR03437 family)
MRTLLAVSALLLSAISHAQVITTVAGGGGNGVGDGAAATAATLQQPSGVAVDSAGNLYIADGQDQRVRKVNAAGLITTFAGTGNRDFSGDGSQAANAGLNQPSSVAVDSSGNVYIADRLNHRVRKVTPTGLISTFAGNGTAGFSGDGGAAGSANLNSPSVVAVDSSGNVYIGDTNNRRVRRVTPSGTISTYAGNGNVNFSGDGGPAISAGISSPAGLAFDSQGNLYVSDGTNRVRRITAAGVISTFAGSGGTGTTGDGGAAASATLSTPAGLAVDAAGNLYISDEFNNKVRKVNATGTISTYAGGALVGGDFGDGNQATNASLALPIGLAIDLNGNLLIADSNHGRIRKVSASAAPPIAVSANSMSFSYQIGGTAPAKQTLTVTSSVGVLNVSVTASGAVSGTPWLSVSPTSGNTPLTVTVTADPTALAANLYQGTITITPPVSAGNTPLTVTVGFLVTAGTGSINTFAGNGIQGCPADGTAATAALFTKPIGLTIDPSGSVYVAEAGCFIIRKLSGGTITTVAGNGTIGFSGDGGPATKAALIPPLNTYQGIAMDGGGNLYIADSGNRRIRKVSASGVISTIAGNGTLIAAADGVGATNTGLVDPRGVAVDGAGNIYIAETSGARIRRVISDGTIHTYAGTGVFGDSGDGGQATSAQISSPFGIAIDAANNLYISDVGASKIRKVTASGVISTVAGNGQRGASGDGGAATSASIDPLGIAVDSAGNVFFADQDNNKVREIVAATGVIKTGAGDGNLGFKGDGGPAINAQLNSPSALTIDAAGNLYIADTNNFRIRRVSGVASPAAVPGVPSVNLVANAFGETATLAPNTWVEIKGASLAGTTRIWLDGDFANGQMPTSIDGVSATVNGKPAFIYFVSDKQVNILTPPDALPGSTEVKLNYKGAISSMTVAGQPLSPSFFVFDGVHATATHVSGSLIGPTTLYPGLSTPASPGETIILYANGLGATSQTIVSGSVSQGGTLPQLPLLKIGGINATVTFAGLVSPGLYQLNVAVPSTVPDGDNSLTGTYNGVAMQSGVILSTHR